jgi:phage terminase large subunit-like protein
MCYKDELIKYIQKANNAEACEYVLKSYQRLLQLLDDERYTVRWDKYESLIKFFSLFKHYTGKSSGQAFALEMWQKFIVLNIFCIYLTGTDVRKHQASYIQVARKNGKSALSAIMALFALLADGEANAQVVLSANSKEQANIVFKMCEQFVGQVCKKHIKKYRTSKIFYREINELFIVSADAALQDGLNPSFAICDEMHAAKNDSMWQVLKSGMGMRLNPHLLTITTAGFNKQSACYNLRRYAIDVLNGVQNDESVFSLIFELDEGDDYKEESTWIKANPNLDITLQRSWLATQISQAANDPMMTTPVLTKNLNMWVDVETCWIPERYIVDAFIGKKDFDDVLLSAQKTIFAGVDLAAVSDLTAVSYMVEHDGAMYFNIEYFLPEDFKGYIDHKPKYREWGRQGHLNFTPGNVTDYDYVLSNIISYSHRGLIMKCFYDPYNATQFVSTATAQGLPMEAYSQTIGAFNRPTKELERLILSGKAKFVLNPITLFCFRNATLKFDYNANCKPIKGGGIDSKIDGIIASIMAMAACLMTPSFVCRI